MIAATSAEQRTAKVRFFIAYLVSVSLLLLIGAYLWKRDVPVATVAPKAAAPVQTNSTSRANRLLLNQYQQLQNSFAGAAGGATNGEAVLSATAAAEGLFIKTLDSLEEVVGDDKNDQTKEELQETIKGYRTLLASNTGVVKKYAQVLSDNSRLAQKPAPVQPATVQPAPTQPAGPGPEVVAALQRTIDEKNAALADLQRRLQSEAAGKDQTIARLQSQLSARPVQVVQAPASNGGGEWKQKHDRIKASYDNVLSKNNALANSNKSLVDDNRRLLSQLQAARKQ